MIIYMVTNNITCMCFESKADADDYALAVGLTAEPICVIPDSGKGE